MDSICVVKIFELFGFNSLNLFINIYLVDEAEKKNSSKRFDPLTIIFDKNRNCCH